MSNYKRLVKEITGYLLTGIPATITTKSWGQRLVVKKSGEVRAHCDSKEGKGVGVKRQKAMFA